MAALTRAQVARLLFERGEQAEAREWYGACPSPARRGSRSSSRCRWKACGHRCFPSSATRRPPKPSIDCCCRTPTCTSSAARGRSPPVVRCGARWASQRWWRASPTSRCGTCAPRSTLNDVRGPRPSGRAGPPRARRRPACVWPTIRRGRVDRAAGRGRRGGRTDGHGPAAGPHRGAARRRGGRRRLFAPRGGDRRAGRTRPDQPAIAATAHLPERTVDDRTSATCWRSWASPAARKSPSGPPPDRDDRRLGRMRPDLAALRTELVITARGLAWARSGVAVGSPAVRLVIARCPVDYVGRLTAHLPMAPRLLLIKVDGSVSIHADDRAYKPLNWMSPPCWLRGGARRWTVREQGRRVPGHHDRRDPARLAARVGCRPWPGQGRRGGASAGAARRAPRPARRRPPSRAPRVHDRDRTGRPAVPRRRRPAWRSRSSAAARSTVSSSSPATSSS